MSTTSVLLGALARLLGKWYMSAVLMLPAVAEGPVASLLAVGELSRRVRLVVGDSGVAAATFGFDCVLKSSWMVLAECFRFSAPGLADIGRVGRDRVPEWSTFEAAAWIEVQHDGRPKLNWATLGLDLSAISKCKEA